MPAVPKRQRSKRRQRTSRNTHDKQKVQLPDLVELPSGKRVPRHLVTKDNPTKNGLRFVKSAKKK